LKRFVIFAVAASALTAAALVPHGHTASVSAAPDGKAVYTKSCASCHNANGQGLTGTFPPLAKNSVVTGDPSKVVHILLNGLNGAIKVNGTTYNNAMPPWKGTLSNADIAAVITYIRSSWGNKASAVTEAQVAKGK